ncbi:MAG: hypothetical protein SLAVMIC_00047 [uncultured marine phage]|uniref:Uncharacterized protein n=1 Tax=uncultured marine phage TaxID=707152 RepID=A0A8D9CBK6_9VIRU|nr:MAG: hypothetical protein SLAVMIC_00047 [uncultured marine phage]
MGIEMGIFGYCVIGWYVLALLIWIIYGGLGAIGENKKDIKERKETLELMPWSLRLFSHILTFIYFFITITITPLLPILMLFKKKKNV